MGSIALHVLTAVETHVAMPLQKRLDLFAEIPAWQFSIYWSDLRRHCPTILGDWTSNTARLRNFNALQIHPTESGVTKRCADLSPDGRGLAWVMSGGPPNVYGECALRTCPRCIKNPTPTDPER